MTQYVTPMTGLGLSGYSLFVLSSAGGSSMSWISNRQPWAITSSISCQNCKIQKFRTISLTKLNEKDVLITARHCICLSYFHANYDTCKTWVLRCAEKKIGGTTWNPKARTLSAVPLVWDSRVWPAENSKSLTEHTELKGTIHDMQKAIPKYPNMKLMTLKLQSSSSSKSLCLSDNFTSL